jgi:hypothetical protein
MANNEQLMKDALKAIETLKSRVLELEAYTARLERLAGTGSTTKSSAKGPLQDAIGSVLEKGATTQGLGSSSVSDALDAELTKRRKNQAAASQVLKGGRRS